MIEILSVNIQLHRECSYPFLFGGSKARKLKYILEDAKRNNSNAIVSTGSASSNHARDCALAAAELGWRCVIIIHDKSCAMTNNIFLMKLSGAELIFCDMHDVSSFMTRAMLDLKDAGLTPYYIWGGGHSVFGSHALYDAAKEYSFKNKNFQHDFVVVPSGTGGTQAGLHLGFAEISPSTKVLGISVARNRERGISYVEKALLELKEHLRSTTVTKCVEFYDDWVGNGYGETSVDLIAQVKSAALKGVLLDTTYTGKAWQGMIELIVQGVIPAGSRVLFWHTGGIFNLLDQKTLLGR